MASLSTNTSYTSSASHAASEGFTDYTREEVSPFILADLQKCEHCEVDALLGVFLERCHEEITPRVLQSADAFHNSQASSAFEELPPGGASTRAPTSPTPMAPDTYPEATAASPPPPSRSDLLESCLNKVTNKCENNQLQHFIEEYQQGCKEGGRYEPFINLANHALELMGALDLPALRQPSGTNIIFKASHNKQISGIGGSRRSPDIIIVSKATETRVQRASSGNNGGDPEYKDDDKDSPRGKPEKKKSHTRKSSPWFEWPDILISAEMKWEFATLESKKPEKYSTNLRRHIAPLAHPKHASTTPSSSVSSTSNLTSSTSTSSVSIHSSSVNGSIPLADGVANQGADPSNNRKRPIEHPEKAASQEPTKKRSRVTKNKDMKARLREAFEQSGINGAEMLRCSYGRRNAIGLVIIDAVLWIWWFDRQGTIQSTGIDFIEDLPRFLVFLGAIQRFNLSDWGFDLDLDPSMLTRHFAAGSDEAKHGSTTAELAINQNLTIRFSTDVSKKLPHEVFCINGRATNVFEVTSPMLEKVPLVAKLYWPNKDQLDEATIIELTCKDAPHLRDHLPHVFGSLDIDPIGTAHIREELGISSNSSRFPRLLRIIVFERLIPITDLSGKAFVIAWVQCIRCHYVAWNNGSHHRDLSLTNLMARYKNNQFLGVVNDWDLSYAKGKSKPRPNVTATVPFMGLDLLERTSRTTEPARLYYDDLESFLWILFWVVLTVEDKVVRPGSLKEWRTGDIVKNRETRCTWLIWPRFFGSPSQWKDLLLLANDLIAWLRDRFGAPDLNETAEKNRVLLVCVLSIVAKHLGDSMPDVPTIDSL
ncbi:hypothetical protein OPQ81_008622 [Rhizoctonia solani]|nr:hypothetical protein OPQ81_008622 [Rhizoctonia solani]